MSAIVDVLVSLHAGERQLAAELAHVREEHAAEHDVYHVARDLIDWSNDHVRRLARAAGAYGQELASDPVTLGSRSALSQATAGDLGDGSPPGVVLLRDLETVYLAAAHNSLRWEILAQGAQALREGRLVELASTCHPETLRQLRWANTKLKESAAQTIASLS